MKGRDKPEIAGDLTALPLTPPGWFHHGCGGVLMDGALALLRGRRPAASLSQSPGRLRLGERSAAQVGEARLPGGIPAREALFGHADAIHHVDDGLWRRITVANVRAALGV